MLKVAIYGKGGIGKSTITSNRQQHLPLWEARNSDRM